MKHAFNDQYMFYIVENQWADFNEFYIGYRYTDFSSNPKFCKHRPSKSCILRERLKYGFTGHSHRAGLAAELA
jgi:hypothetical protein